jgi:hypothetical protein
VLWASFNLAEGEKLDPRSSREDINIEELVSLAGAYLAACHLDGALLVAIGAFVTNDGVAGFDPAGRSVVALVVVTGACGRASRDWWVTRPRRVRTAKPLRPVKSEHAVPGPVAVTCEALRWLIPPCCMGARQSNRFRRTSHMKD